MGLLGSTAASEDSARLGPFSNLPACRTPQFFGAADRGSPGSTFPEQPGTNGANGCNAVLANPGAGLANQSATANAILDRSDHRRLLRGLREGEGAAGSRTLLRSFPGALHGKGATKGNLVSKAHVEDPAR